jgi:hypothetical protein
LGYLEAEAKTRAKSDGGSSRRDKAEGSRRSGKSKGKRRDISKVKQRQKQILRLRRRMTTKKTKTMAEMILNNKTAAKDDN